MENIVFHIGAPKTGTSIIQSHLAQNREILCDKGFFYPITISADPQIYRTFESHHLLTYAWADWEPFNLFKPAWFFERAAETANKHNLHTMLLSAENTYWLPYQLAGNDKLASDEYWDRKARYIDRIHKDLGGFKTKIVVYLRRQDRWIESWYNQQVKNGHTFGRDMDRFVDHFAYLIDHAAHLKLWGDAFGQENIIVRVYEKQQLPEGLFADFATTVGLGPTDDFPLRKPGRHNSQLSRHALEFMEICNGLELAPDARQQLRLLIRKITNQFESRIVFQPQSLLTPAQRTALIERFEPINQSIARDYLGREDGRLFFDPTPDLEAPWEPYEGLPIDVMTQYLMQVLLETTGGQQQAKAVGKQQPAARPVADAERRDADNAYWRAHIWDYE